MTDNDIYTTVMKTASTLKSIHSRKQIILKDIHEKEEMFLHDLNLISKCINEDINFQNDLKTLTIENYQLLTKQDLVTLKENIEKYQSTYLDGLTSLLKVLKDGEAEIQANYEKLNLSALYSVSDIMKEFI